MTDRPVLTTFKKSGRHWVGDGFLTQSLLPYQTHAQDTSPFLLAGYNPPMWFDATNQPKGVGMHPHRGFETVTIVYQGGVEHGDTMGNRGKIGPGEVQWMTAAHGVQHEEFHSDLINAKGGTLEMVQLWVNLPAKHKLDKPRYQSLGAETIPTVALGAQSSLRVIAGDYAGTRGPAETFSPLDLWDIRLAAGDSVELAVPASYSASLLLLEGAVGVGDGLELDGASSVLFERAEGGIRVTARSDAKLLLLAGEPLNEPLAMGGPFVMNTEEELHQAFADFRRGLF